MKITIIKTTLLLLLPLGFLWGQEVPNTLTPEQKAYELSMACYNIESKDTGIWLNAVKSFDGDKEAQIFYILNFIHRSWLDDDEDPKKAAANAEILATIGKAPSKSNFAQAGASLDT